MNQKETLKENDQAELLRTLANSRERLRQFRFKSGQSKTKNVKEGRQVRREIARILTKLKFNNI
ncbi:MAG: 50S ribosomal protein L29 [Patescibacteria group bacterium]